MPNFWDLGFWILFDISNRFAVIFNKIVKN